MCAPYVMDVVRRAVSRRQALGFLAAPAVATVVARRTVAQPQGAMLTGGFTTVHDLTHTLTPQTAVYPAFDPMQIEQRYSIANDGFYANDLTFNEHTGTHLDAPIHFAAGTDSTDQMDPRQFFAPLAVISVRDRAAQDPDTGVTVDDLRSWERQHGRLPDGAFVAMHSGWDRKVSDTPAFRNMDAQGVMHFPGFTGEAAAFLTEERDIVGAGVDTLSLDLGIAMDFAAHLTFLPANKYGLELMANLESVPPAGATLIVGAPKHVGGSGGPARVFAVS